ncbi:MAG: chromosome partitioning protein ParA [Nitrospirales bacterium]|nr:MAG: chromosome partitioning protein ParA [Nitrospirales bacterium]
MPVISFASPKGGAGKTTAALLLATELAHTRKDFAVTLIDCDPRQWSVKWGQGGQVPENMTIIPKPSEKDILDEITKAKSKTPFVIVDLEGTNSTLVAFAISRSDLVVIPTQAGPMEGESAGDAIKLVKLQEQAFERKIPFAVLMTRMSAVIRSKIEKDLTAQMESASVPVFTTQLLERNAFKSIYAYQCPLWALPKSTYKLEDAKQNARAFAGEVIAMFVKKKSETPMKEEIVA